MITTLVRKSFISGILVCGLIGSPASAALIANFDFENYANGSTGNDASIVDDSSTLDRVYDNNSSLPTGIMSVSEISFTVSDPVATQNKVELNNGSNRFRWRLNGPVVTASFSVTIAAGYTLDDFYISLIQHDNTSGTYAFTYNGNAMGSGSMPDINDFPDNPGDVITSNTIASPLSGTINFVLSIDPATANRTSRWDDIQLNGDVVLVPEPSSLALLMSALLGGVFLRRRR